MLRLPQFVHKTLVRKPGGQEEGFFVLFLQSGLLITSPSLPVMDCHSWVSSTSPIPTSVSSSLIACALHFPEATCLSFFCVLYLTV